MIPELEKAYGRLAAELNGIENLVVRLMRWWYGGRGAGWQNMDGVCTVDGQDGLIGLDFAMTTDRTEAATEEKKVQLCRKRLGGLMHFQEFLVVLIKPDSARSFTVNEAGARQLLLI